MKKTGENKKKTGKLRNLILGILVAVVVLIGMIVAVIMNSPESDTESMPWENGGKQPSDYTWEEFEALEGIQKDHFFESFESADAFEKWMIEAGAPDVTETVVVEKPWEETNAKKPVEYSWDEFQNLGEEQKDAFFESFESPEAFEGWLQSVNPEQVQETTASTEVLPWEEADVATSTYTWEAYQALSPEEKDAFFESFESPEAFEEWMNHANSEQFPSETQEERLWEADGKQPSEYTWDEFLQLSPEQQEEFFLSFPQPEQFEAWMNRVKQE